MEGQVLSVPSAADIKLAETPDCMLIVESGTMMELVGAQTLLSVESRPGY